MNDKNYWRKRFEKLEQMSFNKGLKTYKEIEKAFIKAEHELNTEIEKWYIRLAKNNGISLQEAKKFLNNKELKEFKWNVEEYIERAKEGSKWKRELENASAKVHISRLESLKISTQQYLETAFGNMQDKTDELLKNVYTEGYYRSAFEIEKGIGIGIPIAKINVKELEKLINKPWTTDDMTFSDRIWDRKEKMINELHQELIRTCIKGDPPDAAIKHMEKFVNNKIKNAKSAAARIVQTEQAYFHSVSQKDSFKELDVDRYQIVATLDDRTSEICQDMDGKIFKMSEFTVGTTAPPFHPRCRTDFIPYFDDYKSSTRAAKDKNGKTYYVPGSMTYKEWKKEMVQ